MIKSLLFWSYLVISSILLYPIALIIWLLTVLFDPQLRALHMFTCWWAYHYVALCPFWILNSEHRDSIDRCLPTVLVANHQSMGDILVLFGLRKHFKWVAKDSLFKVPFIGWNMALNRYVPLQRKGMKSITKMMQACTEHIKRGSSILIFPEGTRSTDGNMQRFKVGAFQLACNNKIPVTPIVIDGTFEALPKSGWLLRNKNPVSMKMRVLEPINPAVVNYEPDKLLLMTHQVMTAELIKIRAERYN